MIAAKAGVPAHAVLEGVDHSGRRQRGLVARPVNPARNPRERSGDSPKDERDEGVSENKRRWLKWGHDAA